MGKNLCKANKKKIVCLSIDALLEAGSVGRSGKGVFFFFLIALKSAMWSNILPTLAPVPTLPEDLSTPHRTLLIASSSFQKCL